jgi:NAD(P)-dependent dehydrogenase (short-subunit alcohol dehydrogenase family)
MGQAVTGRIEGKVAIVTGGASGIGAGTARRFVAEGARVVVADLQEDAGKALVDELGEAARFVRTDVADEDDVAALVDYTAEEFGRLDVMFNNAGIIGAIGSIAKCRMSDVDRTFSVILRGTFLGMKHAARVMIPRRSGVILSTSSPGGMHGGLGPHAYSAAKAGVIGLTRSAAAELRHHGIRVNAIAPGAVVSAMTADLVLNDPTDLARVTEALSAGGERPGMPEDIAAAALYLASDEAAFMTGSVHLIDGGVTYASGPSAFARGEHEEPAGILEAGRRS